MGTITAISALTAWIYARRSRTQETHASVADQVDRGHAACDEHGWTLGGVLEEEVSASRYARKKRDRWPEMLALLGAGRVGVLILWESSRGDRKAGEWMYFLDLCQEHGVIIHVISHDRTYDPRNHRDWKTLASEGVDNDHFTRRLSVEVKRGKARAMKQGRPSGPPPYGYEVRYDDKTGKTLGWEILPGEDVNVRQIIRDIGNHRPGRRIALEFIERGIPSRTGAPWSARVIRHIAGNCAYAGLVELPDGTYAERQEQEDGAQWPAIVERAEWEKAAAVLKSRATGPRPGAAEHLLTSLADCECGGLIEAAGKSKGTYRCGNYDLSVPEEWLDEVVRYTICRRLARPDARDLFAAKDDNRTAELRATLEPLRARREKFRKMAAAGTIEPDALADIEAELNPKIARLQRELGEVRYVPALADILTEDDTFAAWDAMPVQARREVIAAVTGITVMKRGRNTTAAERRDMRRVVFDGTPQLKPGGRAG
jgi:site-specific DNA recombinase